MDLQPAVGVSVVLKMEEPAKAESAPAAPATPDKKDAQANQKQTPPTKEKTKASPKGKAKGKGKGKGKSEGEIKVKPRSETPPAASEDANYSDTFESARSNSQMEDSKEEGGARSKSKGHSMKSHLVVVHIFYLFILRTK